ncbi:hypothetical protein SLUN_39015 (plasmid) [Streptomyces lunaelactis]|uniref:DUF2304 domain-containing protein n=1 Tax=Streptomyces lunaelactis TaxID=1535768 RepID=A0A2R4TFW2_9ACTN|nr:hypothetical protein [Streptomyces lunaelactis]AVZ78022.1 hypothetical protein SLUN_39015 [Streptomyces lunaelactis]NUK84954.1 hypothetical protein [Streptomyces lunaelactis]
MITVSAVIVFIAAEVGLIWKGGLKFWHAAVCNIAALYLAATSAGPTFYNGLSNAAQMLSEIRF